ncbi:hypothetical protein TNCV_3061071 [Trichonephila clavipes]|nr:hypothetical protein TNCV_3061071 [Trichonephila clavipes]
MRFPRVQKLYRPTSLHQHPLCKLMERVIHRRLHELAHRKQKTSILSKNPAYRAHHGTTDQLFYLNQSMVDGFQEKASQEKTFSSIFGRLSST